MCVLFDGKHEALIHGDIKRPISFDSQFGHPTILYGPLLCTNPANDIGLDSAVFVLTWVNFVLAVDVSLANFMYFGVVVVGLLAPP